MEGISDVGAIMGLIQQYGLPGITLFLLSGLVKRADKVEYYFKLIIRLMAIRKSSIGLTHRDILTHNYFDDLEGIIERASITRLDSLTDKDKVKFKMYIADVVILINHWCFRKELSSYLKAGNFKNLDKDIVTSFKRISEASSKVIAEALNQEIATVYKDSTRVFREVYFEAMYIVVKTDKVPPVVRAYMLLDLLQYRIHNSHTILYKTFLDMNGKVEAQMEVIEPKTKSDIIKLLNNQTNG